MFTSTNARASVNRKPFSKTDPSTPKSQTVDGDLRVTGKFTTAEITNVTIDNPSNMVTADALWDKNSTKVSIANAPSGPGESLITTSTTSASWNILGDLIGPPSATDNALARFDLNTGKIIQNSMVLVDDDGKMSNVTIDDMNNTVTADALWDKNGAKVTITNTPGGEVKC